MLQLLLTHWFAIYDDDRDGLLQLEEYCRLVSDYQLPLTAADEIFTTAIKEHKALATWNRLDVLETAFLDAFGSLGAFSAALARRFEDLMDFQALLEKSGVLSSGGRAIEKDDEMGRAWRELEATQQRLGDARVAPKWIALGFSTQCLTALSPRNGPKRACSALGEPVLRFSEPTRVFVADGRLGICSPAAAQQLRCVCVSDTHGQHRELSSRCGFHSGFGGSRLPPGDVLLHAGDFSMEGGLDEAACLDFMMTLDG